MRTGFQSHYETLVENRSTLKIKFNMLIFYLCIFNFSLFIVNLSRPFNDRHYPMDSSKVEALGWKPVVQWDDGIEKTSKLI